MRSLIATLAIAPAIALAGPPKMIEFWRGTDGSTGQVVNYGLGPMELPAHPSSTADGAFISGSAATNRPAGTTTQWLTFDVRSEGLFSSGGSPNSHAAIVLRWEGTMRWNRGHGIIFGRSGRGAPSDYARAQIESWWQEDEGVRNWVSPEYGDPMYDGVTYRVRIHVGDGGHVAYEITDQYGAAVAKGYQNVAAINGENSKIESLKLGGIAFALVFANTGTYALTFSNINTGWF